MRDDDGDGDQEEPCSTLSYECVDDMTLPAINRGDTKYIALVMAKTGLLTRYADSVVPPLAAQYKWRIHRMTSAEANLMNAAKKDCPGECCRRPFTTEDIVVDLPSFLRFYEIVRDCVMLASLHPAALREGGWLQVNNAVCPYVWRSGIRYVPLLIINLAAEVTIGSGEGETSEPDGTKKPVLVRVTPPELTFLNDLCTQANQNFRFDANTDLVSLIDVKLASNAIIFDLPPSRDPFDYALFLGRMDAETVAAGKLAIKAGWDQFLRIQQTRKSPAPSESTATSESLQAEEPVFVDDSDSSEVIVLSPTAADSEPADESVSASTTVICPSSTTKAAVPNARAFESTSARTAPVLADDMHAINSGNRDVSGAKEVVSGAKEDISSAKEAVTSTRAADISDKESVISAKEAGSGAKEGTKSKQADSRPKEAGSGTKATASSTAAVESAGDSEPNLAAACHPCGRAAVTARHNGSISSWRRNDCAVGMPNAVAASVVADARSLPATVAAPATFPGADAVCAAAPGTVSGDLFTTVAAVSPDGSVAASAGSPDVCAAQDPLVLPPPLVLPSPSPDSGFLSPLPSPTEPMGTANELLQDGTAALRLPAQLPPSLAPSMLQPDLSAERIAAQYGVLAPVVRERRAQGLGCDGEVLRLLVWFVHIQQQLFALLRQQLQVVQCLRGHDRALVDECLHIINDMLSSTKFWLSRRHEFAPRTRAVLNHTLTCAVLQRRVQSHLNYLVGGLFCIDTPAAFENFTFLRNLVALALILQGARHSHVQQPMTAYTIVERCKCHLLRHVTAWSAVKLDSLGHHRDSLQDWWAQLAGVYTQVYKYADEKATAAAAAYRLESDLLLRMQPQQVAADAAVGAPGLAASAAAANTAASAVAAAAAAAAAAAVTAASLKARAALWPVPESAAPAPAGLSERCGTHAGGLLAYERPEAADSGGPSGGGAESAAAILATEAVGQPPPPIAALPLDGSWAKRRVVSIPPGAQGAAPPSADAYSGCLSAAHLSYADGSGSRQRKTPQPAAGSAAAGSPSPVGQLFALLQASIAHPAPHRGIMSPAADEASGSRSTAARPVHTVHHAALALSQDADAGSSSTGRGTAVFCVHPLNGTPTPCLARGKEWWVLVRDAAHALFPSCTVDEFQLVLEEVLGLQLVAATADDLHVLSMARAASVKPGAATELARADGHDVGGLLLVRCRSLVEHRSKLRSYLCPAESSS